MRIGIDIGSREVKIIGKDVEGKKIYSKISTVKFFSRYGKSKKGKFFVDAQSLGSGMGMTLPDVSIAATGYGKNSIAIEGVTLMPEIKAHVQGAISQTGLESFILLDIGGQDVKVVDVNRCTISDFLMNDRCAAGTGRYLENISKTLNMTLEELGGYMNEPSELSHTCAIFADTEIVTKIAEGCKIDTLAAGANLSVARRISPLVSRFCIKDLVITGGVAKNSGVIYFLKKETDKNIIIPKDPQFNGAIGCIQEPDIFN